MDTISDKTGSPPPNGDPCNPNPCENNGVCQADSNGVYCDCTGTSYIGPHCEGRSTVVQNKVELTLFKKVTFLTKWGTIINLFEDIDKL